MMLNKFSVNKIPFNFFLLSLKKQTPISLLITAFLLLICPGMLVNEIFDGYRVFVLSGTLYPFNFAFPSFCVVIFIVSLLSMLICCLSNFGFLYSKKAGDLYHSLPLTKNQLLLIKAAASFVGALFPLICSYLCLLVINILPFVTGVSAKVFLYNFFAMVSLLFLCTCFTVLMATVSSSFFNFIVALSSISVAPPVVLLLIYYWVEQGYGLVVSRYGAVYTSPYIYSVVKLIANDHEVGEITPFSTLSFICSFVLAFIFISLSLLLFKRRKTETAEQPFSFKFVNVITLLCIALCGGVFIGTIFTLGEVGSLSFWPFLLFGAIITAIAVGALQNKNFKTALKSSLLGCLAAFLVLITFVCSKVYTAYAVRFVPLLDDVESVTINGDLAELQDVDLVLQIHSAAIEQREELSLSFSEFTYSYDINYILKNGKTAKRSYSLSDNELNFAYLKCETRLAFYENPTVPEDTDISVYDDETSLSYRLSDEEYKELLSAYAKDIRKATADVLNQDHILISGRMAKNSYGTLRIFKSYENTNAFLEYLEENGKKY